MSEAKRTPVLGDQKRVKSKLVTPFNDAFGSMREVSWINMMIPELLWIALVQKSWGPRRGVEIITAFTRDVRASDPTRDRTIWAAAGKFAALPSGVLTGVVEGRPYRDDLCAPLAPLHAHYPEHPMRELVSAVTEPPWSQDLGALKEVVGGLSSRVDERHYGPGYGDVARLGCRAAQGLAGPGTRRLPPDRGLSQNRPVAADSRFRFGQRSTRCSESSI